MGNGSASVLGRTPAAGERAAILRQLDRMLQHPVFKNSKRCTSLLSHLVRQALDHPEAHIKERTLGVEVFGRDPGYDTALDPVVRMTANEIRKRIGQYYHNHESDPELELRIELPAGTYTPEFRFGPQEPGHEALPDASLASAEGDGVAAAVLSPSRQHFLRRYRNTILIASAAVVLLAVGFAWLRPPSMYVHFWTPIVASPNRVLICIGTAYPPGTPQYQNLAKLNGIDPNSLPVAANEAALPPRPELPASDATAMSTVVGVLAQYKKAYEVRSDEETSLADLRAGPVILIGIFDNEWTRKLTASLRFRLVDDWNARTLTVKDAERPLRKDWVLGMDQNYKDLKSDFAIVSRYSDNVTGTAVLEIAGMRSQGTAAAAEFVSNPAYLNALKGAGARCRGNIQLVLEVPVVNGITGQPHVIATHCW
jgi:hypothetical protein